MAILLLVCLLGVQSVLVKVGCFHSLNPDTKALADFAHAFESLSNDWTIELMPLTHIDTKSFEVLADLTGLSQTPYNLSNAAYLGNQPLLVPHKPLTYLDVKYQWRDSPEFQGQALCKVFDYYDWTRVLLLIENTSYYRAIADAFEGCYAGTFRRKFLLAPESSEEVIKKLLGRIGRKYGLYAYLFIGGGALAQKVDEGLVNTNIVKVGSLAVYGGGACWGVRNEGSLCLLESGVELANSWGSYTAYSLAYMLSVVFEDSQFNPTLLNSLFSIAFPSHQKSDSLYLANVQATGLQIVGEVNEANLLLREPVTFPGPTNEIPQTLAFELIELGINDGSINPTAPPAPQNTVYLDGAHLAAEDLNADLERFPYHQFQLNSMSCGVFQFNYDFAKDCLLTNYDRLGITYLHSVGSGLAGDLHDILTGDLGLDLPQLGCCGDGSTLSDIEVYPMFMRLVVTKYYRSGAIAWILKLMGITKCAVVYADTSWGSEYYEPFVLVAESLGIELLNSEEYRLIHDDYTYDDFARNEAMFQHIIDTGARYLVYIHFNGEFLEGFYRLGLRRGDLVVVTPGPYDYYEGEDLSHPYLELADAGISIDMPSFVGDLGAYVEEAIESRKGHEPNSFHCYAYDTIKLFEDAFEYSILLGTDYRNGEELITRLRYARTVGCSGTISISPGTNDRSNDLYYVYQATVRDANFSMTHEQKALYAPTSTIILTYLEPFVWTDGSTDLPSLIREDELECEYNPEEVFVSDVGLSALAVTASSIAVLSTVFLTLFARKWLSKKYPPIEEPKVTRFNDMLLNAYIGVEVLQLIALGPTVLPSIGIVTTAANIALLEHNTVLEPSLDNYMTTLQVGLFLSLTWATLCTIYIAQLKYVSRSFEILRFLNSLVEYGLPYVAIGLFIPISSTLFSVFACDVADGNALTDTYLAGDCRVSCWQGQHLVYAVLSILALLWYLPVAVYLRIVWQIEYGDMHIMIQPRSVLVKAIFQLIAMLLTVCLREHWPVLHAVNYSALLGVYALVFYLVPPFNDKRANVLQQTALAALFWVELITTFSSELAAAWKPTPLLFLSLGILVIGVAGAVFYFKAPALVQSKKDKPVEPFFRFQFSRHAPDHFNIQAKTIDFIHQASSYANRSQNSVVPENSFTKEQQGEHQKSR